MRAECLISGCFRNIQTDDGFEPLTLLVDEADSGDGSAADLSGEFCDIVKDILGRRIKDAHLT
ncbi:hypothetical protein CCAX7_26160 [Capsulimonas corticalis]|uniref:Uncharacterized protein n=1 Tax=Capsulimonas corticalis TaxID=2219043 RepID=A0A402D781_9BACT|nr:hypothetical protein CCAX7_26160 [Capsulimonas corticalis]